MRSYNRAAGEPPFLSWFEVRMKKIRLNLDDLKVESFQTTDERLLSLRGTVVGASQTDVHHCTNTGGECVYGCTNPGPDMGCNDYTNDPDHCPGTNPNCNPTSSCTSNGLGCESQAFTECPQNNACNSQDPTMCDYTCSVTCNTCYNETCSAVCP